MGRVHPGIDADLAAWIEAQPVFFVATAPLATGGHVNCSPKGLDTFRILDPHRVGYLDLTGSGAESAAHLRENGRIVVMFCAFAGAPRILRLHGRGRVHAPGSPVWERERGRFADLPGARALVEIEVERIADSCGYGVPRLDFAGARDTLPRWAIAKGEDGLAEYRARNNARSLDGLPALDPPATG